MRQAITLLVLAALSLGSAGAHVEAGVVQGIVSDESGAVLPGVTVTLHSDALTRVATTNARGEFVFRGLPLGRYEVTAALAGFATVLRRVSLGERETLNLKLVLRVGAMEETVEVVAESPGVSSQNTAVASYSLEPRGRFRTESYARIDENPFAAVVDHPLSTFSIDVDTASYANVRRFLERGEAPPKDAVRIEELINYFAFDYPEPTGSAAFAVTTEVAPAPGNPRIGSCSSACRGGASTLRISLPGTWSSWWTCPAR